MKNTDPLETLSESLRFCIRNCHLCPVEAVDDMISASSEMRGNVAALTGPIDHESIEPGGIPAARVNLSAALSGLDPLRGRPLTDLEAQVVENLSAAVLHFREGLELRRQSVDGVRPL